MFHPFSIQIDWSVVSHIMAMLVDVIETIVFKVRKLPSLEVTESMKNMAPFIHLTKKVAK